MRSILPMFLLLALMLSAPALGKQTAASRKAQAAEQWVQTTLRKMTLEEKVGQTIFDRAGGWFANEQDERFLKMKERVQKLHLGGFIIFSGTPHDTAALLNALQRTARIPLLIAGDLERGAATHISMAVSLPHPMAVAATGDPANAAFAGEVTAREGRAIGFHWTYAPVADVNNNPDNPIINIRSFGEDMQQVSKMVAAYVGAAEQHGMLTTAKHFPGHGDTATDSHIDLGVVAGDRARLERVELAPFRAAIEAGVSSIMTAHLSVPAVEPDTRLPATLSRNVLTGLLREQMGFRGLIVTDALEMGGITTQYWPGEAAVRAFEAGADVLLLPLDPELAFRALRDAVKSGRISEQRLEQSVERILRAKARVGLHRERRVDLEKIGQLVHDPRFQARAEEIANRSITLVRDERKALPLPVSGKKKLTALVVAADAGAAGETFAAEVRRRVEDAEVARIGPESSEARVQEVLKRASATDGVLAGLFVRVAAWKGTVGMPEAQVALLKKLAASGKPLVVVSFGSPYLIRAFPEVATYLCAYSWADVSERAAVRAVFGETAITGRLPISIPGIAPLGAGLERAADDRKLKDSTAGQEARFRSAFQVMEKAVADKAFPGGVLAVGYKGALVALKGFGKFDYSPDATAVTSDAIYDLASVSKVVGTTTAAAMLYEQKKLLLDLPVVRYLPEFAAAPDHDQIAVRQLLTHSSGLPSYERLFLNSSDKQAILKRIYAMPLAAKPGEKFAYSDFGPILLGEIIERVTGQPLDLFLRQQVFDPLEMKDTFYNPPKTYLPRIPPTEQDDVFRKRLVRGEVHDENAWVMGGVAGHAGLFSTARDLAAFAQMMLNGGTYGGRRILKRNTVETFTARQPAPAGSTRALGWDTPSAKGSSAGDFFSPRSFGHTGFTGTSLWLDPEKELFVILLSNRVHPTRENQQHIKVRPAVHNAVVEALR